MSCLSEKEIWKVNEPWKHNIRVLEFTSILTCASFDFIYVRVQDIFFHYISYRFLVACVVTTLPAFGKRESFIIKIFHCQCSEAIGILLGKMKKKKVSSRVDGYMMMVMEKKKQNKSTIETA